MKKMFFLLCIMMLYQTTGVSQACEETPITASAVYTFIIGNGFPDAARAEAGNGIEFVHVTGGCYTMGTKAGLRDATPAHEVCVDDYYLGKYEVTQAQWRAIMGTDSSTMSCGDNCPVVEVSWQEAQEFIRRLNERTGKAFRLPTEAEWEYAARSGGAQEKSAVANQAPGDQKRALRPVGGSQPNGLGIYGMQGSVWEWTNDKYSMSYYRNSAKNNPEGPQEGRYRVLRGGSWNDAPLSLQPTLRMRLEPGTKRSWVGFRLSSSDQYSAKYRIPGVLAPRESASRNVGADLRSKL